MASKISKINVQGIDISISNIDKEDYICITDMVKAKGGDSRAADIIKNWIRNRGTIEFLGVWESLNNPDFNVVEFDHFRGEAGLPTFTMSVSNWVDKTGAIGIFSKSGKYGGTYAHKDIAFEFGSAISPVFKLHIIKEYQKLKAIESDMHNLEWNVKRVLSKANYRVHSDAIEKYVIPTLSEEQKRTLIYANEADMLNIIIFGCTAKQWRDANPTRVSAGENIRDMASINELAILANLETLNAQLAKLGISDIGNRAKILEETAMEQRALLDKYDYLKSIKRESKTTYLEAKEQD